MALRLRRDVQKASYYVWFLGAEEAKGLRGSRVINSVLPYLIDRSRGQEPLKVTLQVSHKGIKILQGSSKHFIPHSAITSSVQTDDIVACVLLLYNPATKCPLHVHAYRCDSESTAEALHQQLQILINRTENQKRFEELENRLGILPPMPASNHKSTVANVTSHNKTDHSQKQQQYHHSQLQQQQRRLETSPKRFSSSLGSDTGNSTRESECSEEHNGSPVSRSPPMPKPLQLNNELFDSLAAELRAKLNGNGPPILLPPRDYDTVHRSKGNLTAIELRRCRNKLIVGSTTSPTGVTAHGVAATASNGVGVGVKQVSSRGSSGIGSDLAPSPERQELNSSSDDDRWSNEADNSVIALKPSQIPIERPAASIIAHHPQLNRKSAMQPPEDSYLRDLPAKPYTPHTTSTARQQTTNHNIAHTNGSQHSRDKLPFSPATNSSQRSKTPSSTPSSWTREDEIKPIIMRPADYDAKFNRVLQAEQKSEFHRSMGRDQTKLQDTDKYNEINSLLNKQHLRESESPERPARYARKIVEPDDFEDSDPLNEHLPLHSTTSAGYHRKENLTDKQKFIEYTTQKQPKTCAVEEPPRYGGRHRYVDPADLPFEQQPTHKKYAAVHRGAASPERSDMGQRTSERQRDRQRIVEDVKQPRSHTERERERFSRSSERNPYREPESIPYIQSMEKMMKSTAMRYNSYDSVPESTPVLKDEPSMAAHTKVSQRSKSYPKQDEDQPDFHYKRSDYTPSANSSNVSPKDRFKDAKNKFHAMERTGSRYELNDEKHASIDYKSRRRGSIEPVEGSRIYDDWSDEERLDESPPPLPKVNRTRSRSHEHWEQSSPALPMRERERDMPPSREHQVRERDSRDVRESRDIRDSREVREHRDYSRDVRARELPGMRSEPREIRDARDTRDLRESRDSYRDNRYDPRDLPTRTHERETNRDLPRERQRSERPRDHSRDYARDHVTRRDYTPEPRSSGGEHHRVDYERSMDKQRTPHSTDKYAHPSTGSAAIPNAKILSNLPKGYRHSYAEPVFARTGGRVGLAAVNPF